MAAMLSLSESELAVVKEHPIDAGFFHMIIKRQYPNECSSTSPTRFNELVASFDTDEGKTFCRSHSQENAKYSAEAEDAVIFLVTTLSFQVAAKKLPSRIHLDKHLSDDL